MTKNSNIVKSDSDWFLDNGPGETIDIRTGYGKGLVQEIDPITDFGKGIFYYGVDGNKYPTSAMAAKADKDFFDRMMIKKTTNPFSLDMNSKGYNLDELLVQFRNTLNANSQCVDKEFLKLQSESIARYVEGVYGIRLDELLAQFDYSRKTGR